MTFLPLPFSRAIRNAFSVAFVALLVSLANSSAHAATVPEGEYTLSKIGSGRLMMLGTLEIKGATYRLNNEGAFAAFTIDAEGKITWSAGLNIMPEGWKLGESKLSKDEQGRPLIRINYTSPRNAAEVIDALKEK